MADPLPSAAMTTSTSSPASTPTTIRPAKTSDLPQIHAIFAGYVLHTTKSFYWSPPSLETFQTKYQDIQKRGLPYLVAAAVTTTKNQPSKSPERSQSGSDPNDHQRVDNDGEEASTIQGYAYATPFRGPLLSYSPSVEITIFMHQSHTGSGIGTQLLTALVMELRTKTVHHAFEPGAISDLQTSENDARRCFGANTDTKIRNVLAIMADDLNGPEESRLAGERLRKWYEKFGFEVVGRLKNIGFKDLSGADTRNHDAEKRSKNVNINEDIGSRGRWIDTVYLQLDLSLT